MVSHGQRELRMIGYHSVSVLADAIDKGIAVDKLEALNAMITINVPYYDGIAEYRKYGYVPLEKW